MNVVAPQARPDLQPLVEALLATQGRLGQVIRDLERPHGPPDALDVPSAALQAAERVVLATWPAEGAERALGLLRSLDDLRQIDQAIASLQARHLAAVRLLPEEMASQLRHLIDLAYIQLGGLRDALLTQDPARVQRLLEEEGFLEDWHEVLLGDVVGELAEERLAKTDVLSLLALLRALERIDDHVRNIARHVAPLLE